jgi:hypothetical protein
MTDAPQITLLFATVVQWATTQGANNLKALPGVWTGETDQWTVKLNGHAREVEEVPPYGYLLTHKTAVFGAALGNPTGGWIIGPSEDDLIAHFQAQMPGGV